MFSVATVLRALDLVVAGLAGDLLVGIEHHPHPGRADRVADADQPAARVDRDPAADGERAVLDRLPRRAGPGDAEVVDRRVLGHREAVVRLDGVELVDVGDAGAREGVLDGSAHVREHVRVVGRVRELRR